jgi:ABC-type multidrug transport system permease subunit
VSKEFALLFRDPGGLLMLFVLPALFILVLSLALQGAMSADNTAEKLEILFVDNDSSELGSDLIETLEKVGNFRGVTHINGRRATRGMAVEALDAEEFSIAIVIPKRSKDALSGEANVAIEMLTDPAVSRKVALSIGEALNGFVAAQIVDDLRTISNNCLAHLPKEKFISEEEDIRDSDFIDYSSQDPSFDGFIGGTGLTIERIYLGLDGAQVYPNSVQQNVPGWTVFALFWLAQVLAINMINEKLSGAYKRILVGPISIGVYITGKLIPFFIINLLQAVFMFGIGVFVLPLFGAPQLVINNLGAMALITVSVSCVSIGFGLFMASISRSVFFVASVSASVLIIMCVVGGIMVPKFLMPESMQRLSTFVPQGWALDGYLDILIKNVGIDGVTKHAGILFSFAAFLFLFALVRMSRENNRL